MDSGATNTPATRRLKSRAKFGPAQPFGNEAPRTKSLPADRVITSNPIQSNSNQSSSNQHKQIRSNSPRYHPQSLLQAHNSPNSLNPSNPLNSLELVQSISTTKPQVQPLQLTQTYQVPLAATTLRSTYKPQSVQPIKVHRSTRSKLRSVPNQPSFTASQPFTPSLTVYQPRTNNVWLPKDLGSNRHPNRCHWLGVNPLGYYTPAPTSVGPRSRSLASPRCIVERARPQSNTQMRLDLSVYHNRDKYSTGHGQTILDIAERLHLTSTRVDSRNQANVVAKTQAIAKNTKSMRELLTTEYMPTLSMCGWVNSVQFELALRIYENNQVYYLDQLDAGADRGTVITQLNNLEAWFMCICEPKGDAEWIDREYGKVTRGYSGYCDPDIVKYIKPLPDTVVTYIKQVQGSK